MSAQLFICLFTISPDLAKSVKEILRDKPYHLRVFDSSEAVIGYILEQTEQIDCLLLHQGQGIEEVVTCLRNEGKLLPAVILTTEADNQDLVYHPAQTYLATETLAKIPTVIEGAIADFLQLTPEAKPQFEIEQINEFLTIKQHRLTEKLQERLGYKGVYYKRNPQDFFRYLTSEEKRNLISELTEEYRLILLDYFQDATEVNSKIDQFVTRAFFADLSVSQIMEIHMDLMDQFSQQLKLEGRSDEILLDYRLTLIDIIAHLCEMYRRSIPTKVRK
ncbi:KaiA family protein [Halothece sp. PCC 7418]|uniref:circadian clock protein KaiA n=1 Tax=Halothece sp. (strain PCC 7418) TaxID=65093 RepID=UPI0002A05C96|nr:circadian clock protein KaiA [Halothece sp. PCC 7418]AFZ43276.1 KaiA family protein [Halothece sp. PCC 7418]